MAGRRVRRWREVGLMKYEVTMVITNTFLVDADNEQDAELQVRDLGVWDTLAGADFDVTQIAQID